LQQDENVVSLSFAITLFDVLLELELVFGAQVDGEMERFATIEIDDIFI
jgi:hypothetical protein